jgi:hypothetical protein
MLPDAKSGQRQQRELQMDPPYGSPTGSRVILTLCLLSSLKRGISVVLKP